jgi:hypothetical protein
MLSTPGLSSAFFVGVATSEQPSLSSPDPLPTKTTKAGIAPSPRCDVKTDFAEKKLLLLIYSDVSTHIEEKENQRPSLLLPALSQKTYR